jgi:hypothetical protein
VKSGTPCILQAEFCEVFRRGPRRINLDEVAQRLPRDLLSGEILIFLVRCLIDKDSPADTTGVLTIGSNAVKPIEALRLTHPARIRHPLKRNIPKKKDGLAAWGLTGMFHPGLVSFCHRLPKRQLRIGCGKITGTGFPSRDDRCRNPAFRADLQDSPLQGEASGFPLEDRA